MRILCLTPWFPVHEQDPTGSFILDSIESLVKIGCEVTVLVTQPWRPRYVSLIKKKWTRKPIQVSQFSNKFNLHLCQYFSIPNGHFAGLSHLSYRRKVNPILVNLIQSHQCQLIHAHTEISGMCAIDIGEKLQIPTVITIHGISTDRKLYIGKTKKRLFENPLSKASRVILVGNPLIKFTQQFVKDQNHFRIIGNGFRVCNENNLKNEKKWIDRFWRFISISNLEEGKGIDLNLQALSNIKKSGKTNWTYKIIGEGNQRRNLENLVFKLNLTNEVHFLGACNHDIVYKHLSQSDIFILPSYREAFGVAYLEAMSFGLLTIAVQGQGAQAFIKHEVTGLLTPPNNVDELTRTIEYVFHYSDKIREIAKNGKYHVHNYFTWSCHAKNLMKIYNELIQ